MFTPAELLLLVESIYAGILDPAAWEAAIAGLCRAFDGEAALLVLTDFGSRKVRSSTFVDIDRKYRDIYFDLAGQRDMSGFYRALATHAQLGAMMTGDQQALAAPNFERSCFHAEWLRAQNALDCVTVLLNPTPSVVGGLNIGRPRRGDSYGEREFAGLRALQPHLLRACQARLRLEDAASVATGALAALDRIDQGVLLVDAKAAVVHANRAAEATLGRSDGLTVTRSVLACDQADDTATLRRLVGEAAVRGPERSGGRMAVRRRSGRRPLSALVAPLPGTGPVSGCRRGDGDGAAGRPRGGSDAGGRCPALGIRPDRRRGADGPGAARLHPARRRRRIARRQPRHRAHAAAARFRQDRHAQPSRTRATDAGAPAVDRAGTGCPVAAGLLISYRSSAVTYQSPCMRATARWSCGRGERNRGQIP
jgi:hypothetical protein